MSDTVVTGHSQPREQRFKGERKKAAPEGAVGEWDRLGSTLESTVYLDVVIDQQGSLTIGVDVVHLVADGLLLG